MDNKIKEALQKKKKYLAENTHYKKQEDLFHKRRVGKYAGDFVYGANDGIITTFAVVAGATGAALSPAVIVILGLANLFADGISMGASNFLGKKTEKDYAAAQREKENWEIDHLPHLEIEEIREIYKKKGFQGKDLDIAVSVITSKRDVWLDTMMTEELGIIEDKNDDPKRHGVTTFIGFIAAGFIPLTPYLISNSSNNFALSIIVGGLTLFAVGAARSFITVVGFFRGGLEMLLIGSGAAFVAYTIGSFVEKLVR